MEREPSSTTKSGRMADEQDRQIVFMNGMGILALVMSVYALAQIYGLFFVVNEGLIVQSVFVVSVFSSLAAISLLAWSYRRFRRVRSTDTDGTQVYRLMIFTAVAIYLLSLLQVHLVGSQNALQQLLLVAILLVVSWFFRWRDVIAFYILGNLGLALLIVLEKKGIVGYAPLFVQHETLASLFLDWRIILGQSINYVLVLGACSTLSWNLRLVLEKSERLRSEANRSLQLEIAERARSEKEKEELIVELQTSLDQVKTLQGLLPICMNCKKIRDDKGYWQQVEIYLHEHSPELQFSHGLCPECAEAMFPSEAAKK
ncbi:MAG TPA: hypothetical protein PK961_00880 [bacterium]|nr:hypothetical protein [bacterium]